MAETVMKIKAQIHRVRKEYPRTNKSTGDRERERELREKRDAETKNNLTDTINTSMMMENECEKM